MKLSGRIVHHDGPARTLLLGRIVRGEVGRNYLERVAVIRTLEEHIAAEVHHTRILWRESNRGVPVKAVLVSNHRVTHRAYAIGIRVNGFLRAGACVRDAEHAALRVGVNEPRFCQVGHGKKTVAARYRIPIAFENAAKQSATGPTPIAIILQTTARHVRRLHIVVDVVELRERKRVHHFPCFRGVVTHLPSAIRTLDNPFGIQRVNPHGLMIAVHTLRDGAKIQTAIFRQVQRSG